jgi:uncharacterized protein (DUF433 family)
MLITEEIVEKIPLHTDEGGVVRVGGTRVTLDTVIGTFKDGFSAEEIVMQYPSLALKDVYLVVGYYLEHTAEVEAYLHDIEAQYQEIRERILTRLDHTQIRERLLARGTYPYKVEH